MHNCWYQLFTHKAISCSPTNSSKHKAISCSPRHLRLHLAFQARIPASFLLAFPAALRLPHLVQPPQLLNLNHMPKMWLMPSLKCQSVKDKSTIETNDKSLCRYICRQWNIRRLQLTSHDDMNIALKLFNPKTELQPCHALWSSSKRSWWMTRKDLKMLQLASTSFCPTITTLAGHFLYFGGTSNASPSLALDEESR